MQHGVRIFSLNIETNFWPVGSHLVLFSLGRWSRHIKSWSLGLFYIFNVGVVGFISPPLCAEHILYCTWKNIHTLHSCTAARVGGAPCVWWDTEAAERDLLWGDLTGGSAEPSYHSHSVVSWQLGSWEVHTWSTGQTGKTDDHAGPHRQGSQEGDGDWVPTAVQVPGWDWGRGGTWVAGGRGKWRRSISVNSSPTNVGLRVLWVGLIEIAASG